MQIKQATRALESQLGRLAPAERAAVKAALGVDPTVVINQAHEVLESPQPSPSTVVKVLSRSSIRVLLVAGSPTWDPTTFTAYRGTQSLGAFPQSADATLPAGLYTSGTGIYNRPSMFIDASTNPELANVLSTPWPVHECEQVIQRVWG